MSSEVRLGQCLVCGGRGGWWNPGPVRQMCKHCCGSGRDPDRASGWYSDIVLPVQQEARSHQAAVNALLTTRRTAQI